MLNDLGELRFVLLSFAGIGKILYQDQLRLVLVVEWATQLHALRTGRTHASLEEMESIFAPRR